MCKLKFGGMCITKLLDMMGLLIRQDSNYLRLAASARNEEVLVVAQELARSAIDRLGKIGALKAI